jgi:hypothetical protein
LPEKQSCPPVSRWWSSSLWCGWLLALLYHFDQLFMGCDAWWLWTIPSSVQMLLWPVMQQKMFIMLKVHSLGGPKLSWS